MVEQWIAGTHVALEIVTVPGRVAELSGLLAGFVDLLAGFVELPPVDLLAGEPEDALPPAGATAPPAPAEADPNEGWASAEQARHNTRSVVLVAMELVRLWTALATNHPFWALERHACEPDAV